jgi:hypothetical protein
VVRPIRVMSSVERTLPPLVVIEKPSSMRNVNAMAGLKTTKC